MATGSRPSRSARLRERSFLTGTADKKVRSWETSSGRGSDIGSATSTRSYRCLPGRRAVVRGRDPRPEGLALGSRMARRPARAEPLALADRVWALAFSPDGRTLLTGIERRRCRVLGRGHVEPAAPTIEHEKASTPSRSARTGRTVLTGSEDKTARLWDAATGAPLTPPWLTRGRSTPSRSGRPTAGSCSRGARTARRGSGRRPRAAPWARRSPTRGGSWPSRSVRTVESS